MQESLFTEATLVRLPPGTKARVREVARSQGTTSAEFTRRAIRAALEDAAADDRQQSARSA